MTSIPEEYPKIVKDIENKKIFQSKIDEYLLNTLLEIIKDIKKGKRDEMDIGDIFCLSIQYAEIEGYKLSKKVRDFFFELGTYKSDPSEEEDYNPDDNPDFVEKKAKQILEEISE